MARRSTNSHAEKLNRLPFFARLRREPPFSTADSLELEQAADRISGPTGWYATAARYPDTGGGRLYWFATPGEAEEMQRWIDESGIEDRPPPQRGNGPQLKVG